MLIYYTIPIVRRHGQDKSEMDYAFRLLHIEEFWKMAISIIWRYRQLQLPNSTLRILFLTFISTMSFIYCHLNFHANLLRPWPFPLICLITTGTVVIFLPENSRQFPFNRWTLKSQNIFHVLAINRKDAFWYQCIKLYLHTR
jgi:hypothetical protein